MKIYANEIPASDKLNLISRIAGKDLWVECDFNTYDPNDPDEWSAGWIRIFNYDPDQQICSIGYIYAHEFEDLAIDFKEDFWNTGIDKISVDGIRFYSRHPDLLTTDEVKELLYS